MKTKTHNGALTNMKGFAIALVCAAVAHTTGAETFVVDVNPANGFGGRTDLWNIDDAGTLYAEWDVFDSPISDSSPDIGLFGLGAASITENTGAAFLTSGGNIYSPVVATDFTTTLAGTQSPIEGMRTVVAHVKTLGSVIADSDVRLTIGASSNFPFSKSLLNDVVLGGFGGNDQEWLFVWKEVPDGSYTFDFNASEPSMSLGRYATFASDVTPVPEPGTCVLFGLASMVVLYMVRRRRGAVDLQRANA
jgi:hypothetical protein